MTFVNRVLPPTFTVILTDTAPSNPERVSLRDSRGCRIFPLLRLAMIQTRQRLTQFAGYGRRAGRAGAGVWGSERAILSDA